MTNRCESFTLHSSGHISDITHSQTGARVSKCSPINGSDARTFVNIIVSNEMKFLWTDINQFYFSDFIMHQYFIKVFTSTHLFGENLFYINIYIFCFYNQQRHVLKLERKIYLSRLPIVFFLFFDFFKEITRYCHVC